MSDLKQLHVKFLRLNLITFLLLYPLQLTPTTSEANGLTPAAVCITAVVFLVCGLVCGWLLKSHCSTYLSRLLRRFGSGDEHHDVNGASERLSHRPPLQMNGHNPSNTSQADV